MPPQWGSTQYYLGNVLIELGKRAASKAEIMAGRQAVAAAWELYREIGQSQYDALFQQQIAEADTALAALE